MANSTSKYDWPLWVDHSRGIVQPQPGRFCGSWFFQFRCVVFARQSEAWEELLGYLKEIEGQWEEENKVSLVLDFVYDDLSEEALEKLACAYAEIYCDRSRMDKFPQKRFANKIFEDIDEEDRWAKIKKEVAEQIEQYKANETIFSSNSRIDPKDHVIRLIQSKFRRIIEDSRPRHIEKQLEAMYERA